MTGHRYRGGGTAGGKWGCALAAVVGLPLLGAVFVLAGLGGCVPGVDCHRFDGLLFVSAILIAAAVGFGVRALVNRLTRCG